MSKISEVCGVTFQRASDLAKQFSSIGILKEITGQKRHQLFAYARYLAVLGEPVHKRTKSGSHPKAPRILVAGAQHRTMDNSDTSRTMGWRE